MKQSSDKLGFINRSPNSAGQAFMRQPAGFGLFCCVLLLAADCMAMQNVAAEGATNRIRQARWMEEAFAADTVRLSIPSKHIIGGISTVVRTRDHIFVADERFARKILRFDSNGRFLQQIGREGAGPGEYRKPAHMTCDAAGNLIFADNELFRVTILNPDGTFSNAFSVSHMIWSLAVLENGTIALHDQFVARVAERETIYLYDRTGKQRGTCGVTSPAYKKLAHIPYQTFGSYLTTDGQHLYDADYPDYQVRKYSSRCKLVKAFGRQPKNWRSLLSTDYGSVPNPGGMPTSGDLQKLQGYMDSEFHRSTHLRWIHYLGSGTIGMAAKKGTSGDITKDYFFIFYDTEGNLIAEELKFRRAINSSEFPTAALILASPYALCIVQYAAEDDNTPVQTIRLIFLTLG